jgi:voltage-gated potassium channel
VSVAKVRDTTGALLLAVRDGDGIFSTNPTAHTVMEAGHILIAIGTEQQLRDLSTAALSRSPRSR